MADNERAPDKADKPVKVTLDKAAKPSAKASRANPKKAARPDREGISPEQARVYALLGDVFAKLMLAFAATIAFLAVTFKLIVDPSWPLAAAEVVLTSGVTIVFKHYFPSTEKQGRRKNSKDPASKP